jgi:hypothetical protein
LARTAKIASSSAASFPSDAPTAAPMRVLTVVGPNDISSLPKLMPVVPRPESDRVADAECPEAVVSSLRSPARLKFDQLVFSGTSLVSHEPVESVHDRYGIKFRDQHVESRREA